MQLACARAGRAPGGLCPCRTPAPAEGLHSPSHAQAWPTLPRARGLGTTVPAEAAGGGSPSPGTTLACLRATIPGTQCWAPTELVPFWPHGTHRALFPASPRCPLSTTAPHSPSLPPGPTPSPASPRHRERVSSWPRLGGQLGVSPSRALGWCGGDGTGPAPCAGAVTGVPSPGEPSSFPGSPLIDSEEQMLLPSPGPAGKSVKVTLSPASLPELGGESGRRLGTAPPATQRSWVPGSSPTACPPPTHGWDAVLAALVPHNPVAAGPETPTLQARAPCWAGSGEARVSCDLPDTHPGAAPKEGVGSRAKGYQPSGPDWDEDGVPVCTIWSQPTPACPRADTRHTEQRRCQQPEGCWHRGCPPGCRARHGRTRTVRGPRAIIPQAPAPVLGWSRVLQTTQAGRALSCTHSCEVPTVAPGGAQPLVAPPAPRSPPASTCQGSAHF